MDRREFLKRSVLSASALALAPSVLGQTAPPKLVLCAPLTHSDWMLKPGIQWGPQGVKHMLDACKAAGWSEVYWRVLDGGRADYPSKVVRPLSDWDEDNFWAPQSEEDRKIVAQYNMDPGPERKAAMMAIFRKMDYGKFDSLGAAIDYGHQIGLKIQAWVSINEDDHGWGIRSDFSREHPEFRWKRRDGRMFKSQMSFSFPEVRQYKLAILRELLEKYKIDGLFIDWIRTGDIRDNPQTDPKGVADSGYEEPNVRAFADRYKQDPHEVANDDERWVRVRAQPQTLFMREARKLVKESGKKVPMNVMVGHPWHYRGMGDKIDGNLKGLLLDVKTWAKEGLIDAAVAAGYYRDGGNAEMAYKALKDETEGKVDVWTYAWVPRSVGEVQETLAVADRVGAKQILFWEADYIDDRGAAAKEIGAALRARSQLG
ncbi:MAG TPA: family 10 glycosylhydrolase [Tepidisphaeraceae bacterium]|jgi:hypothetical protein